MHGYPAEDAVTRFLESEWAEGLRLTTIPQALARLGIPDDEETRWRIGRRLDPVWRKRLGMSRMWRGLRWVRGPAPSNPARWLPFLRRLPTLTAEARGWHPAVYILSNDEKLIGRRILAAGQVPSAHEIGAVVGLDADVVKTGLRMLKRVGFLAGMEGAYRLAPGHESLLAGLGLNFHTVTLEGGEQFNVP